MPGAEQAGAPLVAIVTGAGPGIGRAVAEELALAGHTVYAGVRDIEGRNSERAQNLLSFTRENGVALFPLELDVLSEPGAAARSTAS